MRKVIIILLLSADSLVPVQIHCDIHMVHGLAGAPSPPRAASRRCRLPDSGHSQGLARILELLRMGPHLCCFVSFLFNGLSLLCCRVVGTDLQLLLVAQREKEGDFLEGSQTARLLG